MCQINKLHDLIMPWAINNNPMISPILLTDLKLDSRQVLSGNLFIAKKGCENDGRLYIQHAITNGAVAVLSESYFESKNIIIDYIVNDINKVIPVVYFYELNRYISNISGRFYGHPSFNLSLVGVTGTNGKTTITHLLSNWVKLLGEKSAVMGTLGNGELDNMDASYCTTSSAVDVQKMLNQFFNNGITFVSMELSSHGLDQYRTDALCFDVAVFSNLSHDHLNYHKNMYDYEMAKWRLFNESHVKYCVINADDCVGNRWLSNLSNAVAVTMKNNLPRFWSGPWICLIKANYYIDRTDIVFNSTWGGGLIHSQLLGSFNVSNLLLALGALLIMGYPLELLLNTACKLMPVCGRVEMFNVHNWPKIVVDYAHTPDALEQVLMFLKKVCCGQLWCILGCGGNRDKNKRAVMGMLAEQYSDFVIITNDNPRTENPKLIINDIIYYIKCSKKVKVITNRIQAISIAINKAKLKDIILISGKGHEKYQIIGNEYIKYSDQDLVMDVLKSSS